MSIRIRDHYVNMQYAALVHKYLDEKVGKNLKDLITWSLIEEDEYDPTTWHFIEYNKNRIHVFRYIEVYKYDFTKKKFMFVYKFEISDEENLELIKEAEDYILYQGKYSV